MSSLSFFCIVNMLTFENLCHFTAQHPDALAGTNPPPTSTHTLLHKPTTHFTAQNPDAFAGTNPPPTSVYSDSTLLTFLFTYTSWRRATHYVLGG
jgi:hypothetical protein